MGLFLYSATGLVIESGSEKPLRTRWTTFQTKTIKHSSAFRQIYIEKAKDTTYLLQNSIGEARPSLLTAHRRLSLDTFAALEDLQSWKRCWCCSDTDLFLRLALCHFIKPLPLTHIGVFLSQSLWSISMWLSADGAGRLYYAAISVCVCVCAWFNFSYATWPCVLLLLLLHPSECLRGRHMRLCTFCVVLLLCEQRDGSRIGRVWEGRVSELNKMPPILWPSEFSSRGAAKWPNTSPESLFSVILQIQRNPRLHERDKQ